MSPFKDCRTKRIPVIGVTMVFGTTQEGAVDDLEELLVIRELFEKMEDGLTFYIHVDGAWGGYFAATRSTVWNEEVYVTCVWVDGSVYVCGMGG